MAFANVFNHLLSVSLTLTSFLLSLITLLSPTPILHTQVSLLFLRPLSTLSNNEFVKSRESIVPGTLMKVSERQSLIENRQSFESFRDDGPIGLWIGSLGSCSRLDGTIECSESNIIPDFTLSYDKLSLSTRQQSVLPWQLPTSTSSLVASTVFSFCSLIILIGSSLPYHCTKKATSNSFLGFLMVHHRQMAKLACLFGITSLGIGIISTVCLRISMGNAVVAFNVVSSGSSNLRAHLGSGFNQLWASWIVQGIACLVAVCMCGRENLSLSK